MSQVKSSLMKALDSIGKTNGHAAPKDQDPATQTVHEYSIATIAEAYFKKRREAAKELLISSINPATFASIKKKVASVIDNGVADTIQVMDTPSYTVIVDIKNGASFLDVTVLRNTLATKYKLKMTEVEALIESCTDRRDPSQSWKVIERQ